MIARERSNKCILIPSESAIDVDNWGKNTEIMYIYFQEIGKGPLLTSPKLLPEPTFISKDNKLFPDMNGLTEMGLAC